MADRNTSAGREKLEKKLFKADLKVRIWNWSIRMIPITWPPVPHVQCVLNSSAAIQYIETVSQAFFDCFCYPLLIHTCKPRAKAHETTPPHQDHILTPKLPFSREDLPDIPHYCVHTPAVCIFPPSFHSWRHNPAQHNYSTPAAHYFCSCQSLTHLQQPGSPSFLLTPLSYTCI